MGTTSFYKYVLLFPQGYWQVPMKKTTPVESCGAPLPLPPVLPPVLPASPAAAVGCASAGVSSSPEQAVPAAMAAITASAMKIFLVSILRFMSVMLRANNRKQQRQEAGLPYIIRIAAACCRFSWRLHDFPSVYYPDDASLRLTADLVPM